MLAQYIAEHLKSLLLNSGNEIKIPSYLFILVLFAVGGILIGEGLLAFCIYQCFLNHFGLSEMIAALYSSGIFIILSLLLLVYINFIFKRLTAANALVRGYNTFKGALTAFIKGFQNPSS